MNKRTLHHRWRQLQVIKPWHLLVIAAIFAGLSVYGLRANNLHMIALRDAVYEADMNNGDTETALRNLRGYVYGHMNTSLTSGNNAIYPPIQLKYSYDRAISALNTGGEDPNTKIYTDAQTNCEKLFPKGLSGSGRIPCIQDYISSHSIQAAAALPPASLYQFDFVSPTWSADLAGLSIVATALFLGLAVIRWISEQWLRAELDQ